MAAIKSTAPISNSREFHVERKCEVNRRIVRDLDMGLGDKFSTDSEGSGILIESAPGEKMFDWFGWHSRPIAASRGCGVVEVELISVCSWTP